MGAALSVAMAEAAVLSNLLSCGSRTTSAKLPLMSLAAEPGPPPNAAQGSPSVQQQGFIETLPYHDH